MAKKAGSSLGLSIFIIIALLVILTTAGALVATFLGGGLARDAISNDLRRLNSALAVLQRKRYQELELANQILLQESWVNRALGKTQGSAAQRNADQEERVTLADEFREEHALDLVVFFDAEGKVLFKSGAPEEPAPDADWSSDVLLSSLISDQQKNRASGLWRLESGLYHATVMELTRNFDLLGFVGIAASIGPLAEELERTSGAQVVLFADSPTGPAVVASTFDAAGADRVITALRSEGQGLTRVKRGDTVPDVDLELGEDPWLGFLSPLRDAAEKPAGAALGLVPVKDRLAIFRQTQLILLATAAAALVVGFLLSLIVGRRVLAPVRRLAAAAEELSDGNYGVEFPPAKGHFTALVAPLHLLARQLRDREALESYLERASREIPEPGEEKIGAAAEEEPPAAHQLALVGVEMRRFDNPKVGYDPEENIGRFARDLRRISDAVAERQGEVETVSGHRILAVFEGENLVFRALGAATEIMLLLTTRENAFDEPVAPVVTLTHGSAVRGPVRWGSRTDRALAGQLVQQLESLMREAAAGEIFMSKESAEQIYPALKQAGLELQGQRGLLNPAMALYKLTVEAAQAFTGAQVRAADPRGVAQNLTISDVIPGETLGNRYEILAVLGSGPTGTVFKCRDRDRADILRLKILKGEVLADAARLEHLKHALDAARLISHSNILGVHDFGQVDTLAYISSSFIKATALDFFLKKGEPMPLTPAFLLAWQAVEGLRAAHRQKLVHGAFKPQNVLVDPAGRVKVMDFGTPPPVGGAHLEAPYSGAPYLAPELIAGQAASPRSDVYAWAAVFYELATGQVPVAGTTPGEVARKRQEEGLEPPTIRCAEMPETLEAVVLRCLEEDPASRYSNAEELARELEALRA